MKKVAIIGGGAAGLIASVVLARHKIGVDLFEQNSKLAKKIAISGNGHCNISNKNLSPEFYISQNPAFVTSTLKRFGFAEFEKFMLSMGVPLFSKDDGRTYPLSYEAKTVCTAFEEHLNSLHVNIFYEHKIISIEKKNDAFSLICKNKKHDSYDAVIIATGSLAYPQLGGCDDGLIFAQKLSHTLTPTYPALVGLHLNSTFHALLSGVKLEAEATLYVDKEQKKSLYGDVLFTKYGISGLAILDLSTLASQALANYEHVEITLNLLSKHNTQSITSTLLNLCKTVGEHQIQTVLSGIVPAKLALAVLVALKIDPHTKAEQINTKIAKSIINKLQNWRFEVKGTHGYSHAEVCGGGIDTYEIDEKSFESKKMAGVYFVGELLDVTGERGGYNFAFAFASGYLCAQALCKKA